MSLLDTLSSIPDKRRRQGQKYDLAHILFYSILSILCGATSYSGINRVLTVKLPLLNKVFGTKWKRPPATTTIFYVFNSLDVSDLEKAFRTHSKDLVKATTGMSLAIDGKTLRGTGIEDNKLLNVLSVFETKKRIIIAHLDNEGKGNELKSLQEILTQVDLELPKNSIITTDALHTQKKQ